MNATANNYLSTADLRNRRQAVADCSGDSACVARVQRVTQETTLANNARVLDACQSGAGNCDAAIATARQDRTDLRAYRDALETQKSETADAGSRGAIEVQIRQVDVQIRSVDTAIADGNLIKGDQNYHAQDLTPDERMAIGFALDPIGAAGIKAGGRVGSIAGNLIDNRTHAEEQAAAGAKSNTTGLQDMDEASPRTSQGQADSINGLKLAKNLASEEQISQLLAGNGIPVSGVGVPLRDANRLVAEYGGKAIDWIKVSSSSYLAKDGSRLETHAYFNTSTAKLVGPKIIINPLFNMENTENFCCKLLLQ